MARGCIIRGLRRGAIGFALAALVGRAAADDASQTSKLVDLLGLKAGMTVADVGAGR